MYVYRKRQRERERGVEGSRYSAPPYFPGAFGGLLLRSIGLTRRESGERGGGGWGIYIKGQVHDIQPRMLSLSLSVNTSSGAFGGLLLRSIGLTRRERGERGGGGWEVYI